MAFSITIPALWGRNSAKTGKSRALVCTRLDRSGILEATKRRKGLL
jgi:hypothetical protein